MPKGTNLMEALLQAGIPIARACDREGVCGKCGVQVLEGKNHLPKMTKLEAKTCKMENLEPNIRLTCLIAVMGDIEITTNYW